MPSVDYINTGPVTFGGTPTVGISTAAGTATTGVVTVTPSATYYFAAPALSNVYWVTSMTAMSPITIERVEESLDFDRQDHELRMAQAREVNRQHEERRQEHRREQQQQRDVASARARELLLEFLDQEQRECFEANDYFDVRIENRLYRLRNGLRAGNVQFREFDEQGNVVLGHGYCIHPRENLPFGDQLLMQKLLLETDEEEFRRIANVC